MTLCRSCFWTTVSESVGESLKTGDLSVESCCRAGEAQVNQWLVCQQYSKELLYPLPPLCRNYRR